MTEAEAQALMLEGAAIDSGQAEHSAAAAEGRLDDKGQVIAPVDDTDAKAAQWLILPQTLAWAITTALPETAEAYTPEKCMELARAFVPVADKYGWTGLGDSPELTLAFCAVGFSLPGFMAFKARKAAAAAREEKEKAVSAGGYINPIDGTQAGGNGG